MSKLCFSTLGCCDRSLENIVFLAQKYNISAIEIRGLGGVIDNATIAEFKEENIPATDKLLRSSGITPIVLGTSCSFHNEDNFNKSIKEGEAAIKIAEALGIKYIRVFGDKIKQDREACISRVAAGISHLGKCSPKVCVLLEVHGDFNTAQIISEVFSKIQDTKNFGLIWDIEHTHKPYGDDWQQFYEQMHPYIRHIHIKDYSDAQNTLTLIGEGNVPIRQIVARLLQDGYDGYISLEWEKKWHPELPEIEPALDSFIKTVIF